MSTLTIYLLICLKMDEASQSMEDLVKWINHVTVAPQCKNLMNRPEQEKLFTGARAAASLSGIFELQMSKSQLWFSVNRIYHSQKL